MCIGELFHKIKTGYFWRHALQGLNNYPTLIKRSAELPLSWAYFLTIALDDLVLQFNIIFL